MILRNDYAPTPVETVVRRETERVRRLLAQSRLTIRETKRRVRELEAELESERAKR